MTGQSALRNSLVYDRIDSKWVPAFAGMTVVGTGMTVVGTGMTVVGATMTVVCGDDGRVRR